MTIKVYITSTQQDHEYPAIMDLCQKDMFHRVVEFKDFNHLFFEIDKATKLHSCAVTLGRPRGDEGYDYYLEIDDTFWWEYDEPTD